MFADDESGPGLCVCADLVGSAGPVSELRPQDQLLRGDLFLGSTFFWCFRAVVVVDGLGVACFLGGFETR